MVDEVGTEAREGQAEALWLLHRAQRALHGNDGDFCRATVPLFQRLQTLLDIGPIRLHLRDPARDEIFEVATSWAPRRPDYCRDFTCHACLEGNPGAVVQPQTSAGPHAQRRAVLPIRAGRERLGAIEAWYPGDRSGDAAMRRQLRLLADQLAMPIYLQGTGAGQAVPGPQHPQAPPGAPDGAATLEQLTPREREILALIGTGLSNKLIARRLDIAEGTVKVHVKHLLEKLALRSRLELAIRAIRAGVTS